MYMNNEDLIFIGIVYLVLFAVLIAQYVMTSIALYTLAKRRGIANPFLAWIPVADSWITGSVAQEYDEREGHKRSWGKVLFVTSLIGSVGVLVGYVGMIASAIAEAMKYAPASAPMEAWFIKFIICYVLLLVAVVALTAAGIVRYICIFKIYESTVGDKAIKYLLLSIMVPLACPICLLLCRNMGYSINEEEEAEILQ